MEEQGVFKPLDTIVNPLGLCRFYRTDPQKSNVITGLKSAASARWIKRLLELAKELGWPLTIMVFEGGTVALLGLLQELHSCMTLSRIPIHTPEEVKMGQKNWVSCCPICMYVIKNDCTFLNHIIVGHYWSCFSCGKCLEFSASSRQHMKNTLQSIAALRRHARKCTPRVASHLGCGAVTNLATNLRRVKRTRLTRMRSMAWKMTSLMDHHPSPVVKPLLKNKSQVLCIIVDVSLIPYQEVVTARNQRSAARRSCTGSPIRRHTHGY